MVHTDSKSQLKPWALSYKSTPKPTCLIGQKCKGSTGTSQPAMQWVVMFNWCLPWSSSCQWQNVNPFSWQDWKYHPCFYSAKSCLPLMSIAPYLPMREFKTGFISSARMGLYFCNRLRVKQCQLVWALQHSVCWDVGQDTSSLYSCVSPVIIKLCFDSQCKATCHKDDRYSLKSLELSWRN